MTGVDASGVTAIFAELMVTLLASLLDLGGGSHGGIILPLLLKQQRWSSSSFNTMVVHEPRDWGYGRLIDEEEDSLGRRRVRRGAVGDDVFGEPVLCNQGVYQCACLLELCVSQNKSDSSNNNNSSSSSSDRSNCCSSRFTSKTLEKGTVSLGFKNVSQDFYDLHFDRRLRTLVAQSINDYCTVNHDHCRTFLASLELESRTLTFQARHVVVYAVTSVNVTVPTRASEQLLLPGLETSLFVILPSDSSMQQPLSTAGTGGSNSTNSSESVTLSGQPSNVTEAPTNGTASDPESGADWAVAATAPSTGGTLSPPVLPAELLFAILDNQTAAMSTELGLSVSVTSTDVLLTGSSSVTTEAADVDDDDDGLLVSMSVLIFLSIAGALFLMTCCLSAAKAIRDRRRIKARNKARNEEKKKLTSIENGVDTVGPSVVKNGVNHKRKKKQKPRQQKQQQQQTSEPKKNGVPGKPAVMISEHVTEVTVHSNGPEVVVVPNGTTVVADVEKQKNGLSPHESPALVPTVTQNGVHTGENGHIVQVNNCRDHGEERTSPSLDKDSDNSQADKQQSSPEENESLSSVDGNKAVDENQSTDSATAASRACQESAAEAGQQKDSETNCVISVDPPAEELPPDINDSAAGHGSQSDRPVSIDIKPSDTDTTKSPGEDNPAFEATSP